MTNPDLLDNVGDAIYLPMREPGETTKKVVRMSDTGLDVFSCEVYPKFLSTTKIESKLDDVFRFFFDYDEDLGGVPFVEIPSYMHSSRDYIPKFNICKLKDGKAIITKLQAEEDHPDYNGGIGDTEHFKVTPNTILVTHGRGDLISFSYTNNPLEFKSTITCTPGNKVDRMFPTDNKDVFCGFGLTGFSGKNCVMTLKYTIFFYNIVTNKLVDYLEVNTKKYSEVCFTITDVRYWEIIQDLKDKNTFKVFAAEFVFEIKLHDLAKRFEYAKKWCQKGKQSSKTDDVFGEGSKHKIEIDNAKNINSDALEQLSERYHRSMEQLWFTSKLRITENDYLFWDNNSNFFHFDNKTNKYSVLKRMMFKDLCLEYSVFKEVYRDEEEVLYVLKGGKGSNQYLRINKHNLNLIEIV